MLAKSDRDHAYKTPKDKNYKVSSFVELTFLFSFIFYL